MSEQVLKDGPTPDDVVAVINPAGTGRVVLVCEHAANAIPPEFKELGLNEHALQSHIAWDLGALAVAKAMAARLDAPLVAQRVSRLVYDCNRSPNAPDAIPDISEYQKIPGNVGLSAADRLARTVRYYAPFCDALSACLEKRVSPVLITVHSFTPVYKGQRRDVEIGILHDRDSRLADEILKCAGRNSERKVMRNLPYGPEDGVTFTLVRHALPYGLLNVMIEIRNDLIADENGQQAMALRLSEYVTNALSVLEGDADLARVS
jgi:predicted N-formylglutamate amidohydrolase